MLVVNGVTDVGLQLSLHRVFVNSNRAEMEVRHTGIVACLVDAAAWIHQDNVNRGWWSDLLTGERKERNVGELLMLCVSEIAEIPEEEQAFALMDDKLTDRLMFEVELADCAIRLFDISGGIAPDFMQGYLDGAWRADGNQDQPSIDTQLMRIVRCISEAMECDRKKMRAVPFHLWTESIGHNVMGFDYFVGRALHGVFKLGRDCNLNVPAAMIEKLQFNAKREDHKVENRRAAQGKAY